MGIKIEGTKKQKICLLIQFIFLIIGIVIDIVSNVYDLNNIVLLKISEYCSFLVIFILPMIINSDEHKEDDETK